MKKKLIFAFVLALAVCLLLMPTAFAEDETVNISAGEDKPVAQATETTNDNETITVTANSVNDLINQVDQVGDAGTDDVTIGGEKTAVTPETDETGNKVITLTSDIKENIVIDNGQAITINTNGKTINAADTSSNTITIKSGGSLTLNGGGTIAKDEIDGNLTYDGQLSDEYGGTITISGGDIYNVTSYTLDSFLASGYQYVENEDENGVHYFTVSKIPTVISPVVDKVAETANSVVEAVAAKTAEIVATAANDDTNYSIASNESFTIKLSFTEATDEALPDIVSVSVNGVEVEFTIAEDGSIVLAPEVLAALGVGTHVITIKTATGIVTLTIVITD